MKRFESIREKFPVTREYTYLNNAAVSPAPPFVTGAAIKVLEGYNTHGGELENGWHERIGQVRLMLAELAGGRPEGVFLTRNTSDAIILAARGFPWRESDNVVCARGEFPALTVPLSLLAGRGVRLKLVPPRPDNTWRAEDFAAAMDSRTRMLALSWVEFHTGFRHDLTALGALCRERGVFFLVDGVQGLGALRARVEEWGVDLFSAAGHKWLLSPEGTGFGWLNPAWLERLEPVSVSWTGLDDPFDFLGRGAPDARFDKPLRGDARRFEGGALNVAGAHALGRSVEAMLELGPDEIERHILHLNALAAEGLRERGYRVLSPQDGGQRSGITVFSRPDSGNAALRAALLKRKIIVGYPCGNIRVSPHYYNNESDIDRLLAALDPLT